MGRASASYQPGRAITKKEILLLGRPAESRGATRYNVGASGRQGRIWEPLDRRDEGEERGSTSDPPLHYRVPVDPYSQKPTTEKVPLSIWLEGGSKQELLSHEIHETRDLI